MLQTFLNIIHIFVCLFLILPIVFIAALSFGSSQWLIFPPPSWTFKWYQDLFADPRWLYSALTSLKIAAIVTNKWRPAVSSTLPIAAGVS